ncbi:serine/threonine-protein kinase [Streptomyces sp. NPDC006460]|uniref:serine/threonine-protein kinase n=1 Tax=Streptomyces sp. NPDC006460 TaxID=3154304 RepID=UPI0033B2B5C4
MRSDSGKERARGGADGGIEPLVPGDPRRIGPYRLLGRLGSGGMGRVYLARSEGGRTVAVKVVHEEHASDQRFRARFRREVEAVRKVGEHFTAPVLDADPEADRPWVATGFVPGPSLEQVVRGHGPLPAESILALADGLLKALRGIHGAGILHRDLKPSNVMLTVEGPRVIDFGIARALEPSVDSLLTSTGLVVGSPGFMAPEQVRGESLGPAADVFALGCVLMYAATGRLPFGHGASNQHAIMFQIVEAEPDLDRVKDEALRGVIARCLTKSPDERPGVDALLEDPALSGATTADGSWLPPGLVARLARQAARLLDVEALATTDRAPEAGGKRGAGSEDGSGPAPAVSSGTGTLGLRDRAADADGRDGARDPGAAAGSAPEGAGERPERRRGRGTWLVAAAALAVVSVGGSVTYYIQDEARHRDIQGAPGGRGSTPPASPTTGATATPPSTAPPSRGPSGTPAPPSGGAAGAGGAASTGGAVGGGSTGPTGGGGSPSGGAASIGGSSSSGGSSGGSSTSGGTTTSGGSSSTRGTGSGGTTSAPDNRVPSSFVGTWTLSGSYSIGQPQTVTIYRVAPGRIAAKLVIDSQGFHCEHHATLLSVADGGKRINLSSGALDKARSTSFCGNSDPSYFALAVPTGLRHDVGPSHGDGYHYERS